MVFVYDLKKDLVVRIILIGPPGSGKGTQAHFIVERYKIPCVSVGNILRDIVNKKSQLSNFIKDTINAGCLVSNEIIINLIKRRLKNSDCHHGFVLDGFPRTVTQAHFIKTMGIIIDIVLIFSMSEKLIIERVSGRYLHVASGRIYHHKFNPPKKYGYDDITGEPLVSRKDDQTDIMRKRLIEYYCYTIPVIDFYRREAIINSNLRCFFVNCDYNIFDIRGELIKILD